MWAKSTHEVYKIDWEVLKNWETPKESLQHLEWQLKKPKAKGIKYSEDFYSAIGVDFIWWRKKTKRVLDISGEVFIHPKTLEKVTDLIRGQYKPNYKRRGENAIWSAIDMDLMCYMPNSSREDIPEDEVHIYAHPMKYRDDTHKWGVPIEEDK